MRKGSNIINIFELSIITMPAKNPKEYAIKHYQQNKGKYAESSRSSRLAKKIWYSELMEDKFCQDCGETDTIVLEWHHLNPSKKDMSIADMFTRRGKKTILEEIEKCVCLCANCHRRLHHKLRNQE
jgi:hypothetical protein